MGINLRGIFGKDGSAVYMIGVEMSVDNGFHGQLGYFPELFKNGLTLFIGFHGINNYHAVLANQHNGIGLSETDRRVNTVCNFVNPLFKFSGMLAKILFRFDIRKDRLNNPNFGNAERTERLCLSSNTTSFSLITYLPASHQFLTLHEPPMYLENPS